ncbi:MAG: histone deacetylase family protein, partial [Longimicrobiales bacterium]
MHADCGRHDTGWRHPEHQGRLPAIVRAIEGDTPALLERIEHVEGEHASGDAIGRVHTAAHVAAVRDLARRALEVGHPVFVNADTAVSDASFDAACAAAGCAIEAALRVARGQAANAFALTRPPGHHATAAAALGFCLFNNVAIAARALQTEEDVGRILIVDWDVHHGNGTQDVFYEDGSVYYLSLHQWPWYPGTGAEAERGSGRGRGTNRNVTVAAGTPRDEYVTRFRDALDAALDEFAPEFILVSAGYDAVHGDPLGRLLLEVADFHTLTLEVLDRA